MVSSAVILLARDVHDMAMKPNRQVKGCTIMEPFSNGVRSNKGVEAETFFRSRDTYT
jgi:hypothetical protein